MTICPESEKVIVCRAKQVFRNFQVPAYAGVYSKPGSQAKSVTTKPDRAAWLALITLLELMFCTFAWAQAPSFITFESGQVRPLALSEDASQLYVTNTPDNRLEIFSVTAKGLTLTASVSVGLEPVAVAVRNSGEVWVVNHLSDSVSVVNVAAPIPYVSRTLLVGDEPRDIVFSGNDRAFITTAHRGQHRVHSSLAAVPGAGDPNLTSQSVPRADVWVFDGANPGGGLGGTPLKIVELFGDTPRALTVSPDGNTVYAAVLFSGNQTAVVTEGSVCPHNEAPCQVGNQVIPGDIAGPKTNFAGERAPLTGVIVKQEPTSGQFFDPEGTDWTDVVKFSLPDKDVFAIDAGTLTETAAYQHVGTTIFNMVSNPVSGSIYVSNFEANNFTLFEGPGDFGNSTVQGHLSEARITVIKGGEVMPRHLNKHIDYSTTPAPPGTAEHSLSMPLDMVVSGDGSWLAVAAFGSNKIGFLDTEELENDSFDPQTASASYVAVSGGGPSGLALDEGRGRLYVLTRFDNGISVVDTASKQELSHLQMYNPEPNSVIDGRPFLYDANLSSSNGEASCASCHIFGDTDHLAWNLGNPDDSVSKNPIPINFSAVNQDRLNGTGEVDDFHPMKGPLATQTLRGMVNSGSMHWRGDRANGFFGVDNRTSPPFNSELSFNNFIVAFPDLLGRDSLLASEDMQSFTDFTLQISLPPNPIRSLDNQLTASEARGREFFMGCDGPGLIVCDDNGFPVEGEHRSDGIPNFAGLGFTCQGCHILNPELGYFGTDGVDSFDGGPQVMKIPHLRNVYTKVGMFGNAASSELNRFDNGFKGDQIRGFGMFHDGGIDTLFRFFNSTVFNGNFSNQVGFFDGNPQRRDVEAYMFAFDSDLPPIVGQQISLSGSGDVTTHGRINLLIARAEADFSSKLLGGQAKECELVVKGVVAGLARGWLYDADRGVFISDRTNDSHITDSALRNIAESEDTTLTYTCVPYGSGRRIAIDRDLNGVFDND